MRPWPRSIAGRTTLVLIAGMLVILWLGAAVWWLGVFTGAGPPRGPMIVERIATIAAMVDRLPPHMRSHAVAAFSTGGFRAAWSPRRTLQGTVSQAWFSDWAQTHLGRLLRRHGMEVAEIGQSGAPGRGAEARAVARVRLSDGSWLSFTASGRLHGPRRLTSFLLMILVVGGGITGLAVWVARRVTAPLGRFSAAAARLGTDVDAPPLAETGPSEIRAASAAFNQMQQRIRRFVDDRTLMLAAISHDLRTALTRLRLRSEFIDDAEQRQKAVADLDEMQAMLDSTLSFARDDSAAEARTRVDLAALLRTLCDERADAGGRAFYQGPDRLPFAGRPVALRRALGNVIDNAVKYGGEAAVTLSVAADEAAIMVADRGGGIPEDMREKVFAPFFRLEDSRSRETGGTGLGLAVARNIVRRHGGDITLADRPGGGTTVSIALPRMDEP